MASHARSTSGHAQMRYYVYVWEFPVRLFHWVNALCVVVLAVTGYLMGNPVAIASSAEASSQFWFGTMRFLHFATAYVWVAIAVLRLYWGFVGNEYVRFHNFLPFTRKRIAEIIQVIKVDVLHIWEESIDSIGHNALAGAAYLIGFLGFLVSAITGFGLYTAMSHNWFVDLFAWVVPMMGGDHIVRIIHHLMLWFFAIFVMIHIYLAAYHDYVEATGTISSMVGGWKFIRRTPREILEDEPSVEDGTGRRKRP